MTFVRPDWTWPSRLTLGRADRDYTSKLNARRIAVGALRFAAERAGDRVIVGRCTYLIRRIERTIAAIERAAEAARPPRWVAPNNLAGWNEYRSARAGYRGYQRRTAGRA